MALRNADLFRQTPLVGIFQRRSGGAGIGGGGGGLLAKPGVRKAAVVAGILAVLGLVPWPYSASGEAEVIPFRRHHIRVEASLVVDRVDVEEGQEVEAGQVLGALRTEELDLRKSEFEGKLRGAKNEAARNDAAGRASEARAALDQARW